LTHPGAPSGGILLYIEAAETIQAVIKRTSVECNWSDGTNADDDDTKKRSRERR
ncbi:hypothetical protein T06_6406, partial [Trichinella sp. T6]